MKRLAARVLKRLSNRVSLTDGLTIALTSRQGDLLIIAIDGEINVLEAQCRYEPDTEASKGWQADIDALLDVRRQIAGAPGRPV